MLRYQSAKRGILVRLRTVLCVVVVAVAMTGSQLTVGAVADDSADRSEPIAAQPDAGEVVDGVANIIWSFEDTTPLAGVRVDATAMTVDYWWKGDVPIALESRLEEAPPSVTVTAHQADYTMRELEESGNNAFAAGAHGRIPAVARVALGTEGSAIEVGFEPGTIGDPGSAERRRVQSEVNAISRVPATVAERQRPELTTRQNDSDPWFGGSALAPSTAGVMDCSTAFAVIAPGGYGRLLSGSHCDPTGNQKWYDGVGDLLSQGGADVSVRPSLDSMLIDPVGGTNGYVYGGPENAGSGHSRYKLAVAGAGAPSTGGVVCTSGANSGEHCEIDIQGQVLVQCPQAGDGTCLAWQGNGRNGSLTNVAGDSGGPVYHDWGNGTVGARGVINSGAGTVGCPATADPPNGKCYKQVFFIGIMDILNYWNVSIEIQ